MKTPAENTPREFLRCRIAGVTLSLKAHPTLADRLGSLRTRMADFLSSRPVDLHLSIFLSPDTGKQEPGFHERPFSASELLGSLPARARSNDLAARMVKGMEDRRGDPVPEPWRDRISSPGSRVSAIPLSEGVLWADMKGGEALLLLFAPLGAAAPFSWVMSAGRTVLNATMAFLALYLAERKGVLAHGVGVSHEGEGYLFLAPSGGGKTTLSIHCPPGAVLADDGVILKESSGTFRLYATPFRQRPGGRVEQWKWRNEPVPLKALFVLDRAADPLVIPMPRPELMGLLIGSLTHFYLWMDRPRSQAVFDFWRRLTRALPAGRLSWKPGRDFWPAILNFLEQGENVHAFEEEKRTLARGL